MKNYKFKIGDIVRFKSEVNNYNEGWIIIDRGYMESDKQNVYALQNSRGRQIGICQEIIKLIDNQK